MKAVLLAAGKGTRLAPLTDALPKILVSLGGRPLLDRQLAYLARSGVSEVAVNLHHLGERVREHLSAAPPPLPVRLYDEPELLGTAGALAPMRDFLDETFAILYGDVVTDAPLPALAAEHARRGALATLAWYPADGGEAKGVLELDGDGRVASFVEKPSATTGPVRVNAGLHVAEPALLDELPPGPCDLGFDVWPRLAAAGRPLYAWRLDAYLRDVGSAEALAAAERDLAEGRLAW